LPFGEAQFGVSHLSSRLEDPSRKLSESASDNAFTWMLGGGAEYRFDPHWAGRLKVDFLRTHFADTGQSRVRFVMGVMYSFGGMYVAKAAEAPPKPDSAQAAAEARRNAVEQAEREKVAAEQAAEAKRKADLDLAAAEARRKLAMEQLAAQGGAAATPKSEVQPTAPEAPKGGMSEAEVEALRARLLERFNRVLPTTDTPRGLVVNVGDLLFDTGKSDLRPEGREDLAKLSGILLNYPSLRLSIEGHTDNSGSAEFNQTLSEQRANAVRSYLVSQGLDASSLTAQGVGEHNPVADNNTDEGRQKNRRVEIIVSGEAIGTKIGK